jgi:hypothetical protein
MSTFWKWAPALAVLAVWTGTARPDDEIVPEGTTIQLLLLRQKSVQQELKLSPEVVKKILDFDDKEDEAYKKALKLGDKERQEKFDELEKANKKFLEDNLTAEQRKRLEQITLQVSGLHQLNRPEVAKELKLTDEQQRKFAEMLKAARKELSDLINSKKKEGRNEKLAKLREEIDKKIEDALTDEQKKRVRELVGEPFKGELLFEDPEEPEKDKP